MFVVMADVKLKEVSGTEFKKWFSESNKILSKTDGFISRKLLQSHIDKTYRILLEHKSKETFEAMINGDDHKRLNAEAITFMAESPIRQFYNVVVS